MSQSFPPKSVLANMKLFHVDTFINTANDADGMDHVSSPYRDKLTQIIRNVLNNCSFKTAEAHQDCDGWLRCIIDLITTTNIGGVPISIAFLVRLQVMTSLASYPREDIFIVYSETAAGHLTADLLTQGASAVSQLTLKMVTTLQESQLAAKST